MFFLVSHLNEMQFLVNAVYFELILDFDVNLDLIIECVANQKVNSLYGTLVQEGLPYFIPIPKMF